MASPKQRSCAFPSLDDERRTHVETACAAFHLIRQPQTMRVWASQENGPIRPLRINGRLAWPVAEIRQILHASQDLDTSFRGREGAKRSDRAEV
jgi:hypothetical protein